MPIQLSPGGSAPASWIYANQQDVQDAISSANLLATSNQEETADAINVGRVLRAGTWADAYMHKYLKGNYQIPLVNLSADDSTILKEISVSLVVWKLSEWRIFQITDVVERARVQRIVSSWKDQAEEMLSDITSNIISLDASPADLITAPTSNADALDISGNRMYPRSWVGYSLPWRGNG